MKNKSDDRLVERLPAGRKNYEFFGLIREKKHYNEQSKFFYKTSFCKLNT